ncbi:MAG: type I-B CRISPR-associated endonuclease Cas1b [Candidatus Bilamarchaeaceae archaeon]
MKKNLHFLSEGILQRDENTVYFINKNGKRPIPIEQIQQIIAHGSLTISSGVIHYFAQKGIPIHFFNYYGFYDGSFYPRETLLSGELLIKQVEHHLDNSKRMYLAKSFVRGAIDNIVKTIAEYKIEGKKEQLEKLKNEIENVNTITELMNIEARARIEYYECFDSILNDEFKFEKRTRQPPENELNALISFGNSLLYTTTLTEIYNTQLNPTISYLHEPSERRFSLCLDISEIFKPLIVDRLIFYLVNKKIIQKDDFRKELNGLLLTENGKKKFIQYYEEKLATTIKHRTLKRNVSYQRLIRLEAYKLIKHLIGAKPYKPFVMWW